MFLALFPNYASLADKILDVAKMMRFDSERIENIVGEGKQCWLTIFSPFPMMVLKVYVFRVLKKCCLVKCYE